MFSLNKKLDVQLGITDFCNLSCIMCQQTAHEGLYGNARKKGAHLHDGKKGFMSFETLNNFINSLIENRFELRVLSLMWIGETTFHPQFPEFLDIIFDGLNKFEFTQHLVLNNNGTLFSEEIEEKILKYKSKKNSVPFTLIFSLDAATRDKFRRIKRVDLFNDAISNIKRYFKNRKKIESNPYRPLTTAVQTLVLPENISEMGKFKEDWTNFFNEEKIEFDLCHDTLHGFYDNKLYFKRASSEEQGKVEALHRKIVEELEIIHPFISKQERIVEFDSSIELEDSNVRRPCPALFRTAAINWDGNVVPCCIDTEMQLILGNVNEIPFPEIYESDFAKKLQIDHICGNFEKYPVCKWCHNLHYPPVSDKEIVNFLKSEKRDELIKPFLNRMKNAGKLRKEKNYTLVKPLDFRGIKQTLIVEISAACNLKCVMCEQSFDKTRKNKGLMKFETFKKIIDELVESEARANVVSIFWSGESLVHPDFKKMINYAAKVNADYRGFGSFDLHTNGNLLDEKISDEIIAGRQFARILISLDAATGETYDKIRRGGNFQKVVENIKYLVKKRNELNEERPRVTLQFVLSDINAKEVKDFIKLADDIFGKGKFQINYDWDKPSQMLDDAVFIKRIDEINNEEQIKSEELHKKICLELGLIEKIKEERIVESDEYRVDDSGINPLTHEKAIRKPCVGLFTHMAIRWDGVVSACCRDIKCNLKIGNIEESTLLELFNSDRLINLRLKHIEGRADEIAACRDCPNQISPVITDDEIIHYLKSIGRSELIVPYLIRMGKYIGD